MLPANELRKRLYKEVSIEQMIADAKFEIEDTINVIFYDCKANGLARERYKHKPLNMYGKGSTIYDNKDVRDCIIEWLNTFGYKLDYETVLASFCIYLDNDSE